MTVRTARITEGTRERSLPMVMIVGGLALLFMLAFDQGQLLSRVIGDTAYQQNLLHEFFHDGRHLFAFACH